MISRFWTCAILTILSAALSAYYSIALLFAAVDSDGSEIYAASRSIALLIAILLFTVLRSRPGIIALALVMILIQAFDGAIGVLAREPATTYGPFALALINVAALLRLTSEHR